MPSSSWIQRLLLVVSAGLILLAFGCSSDKGTDTPSDPEGAQLAADVAGDSLASLMASTVDPIIDDADSSFRPHDIDFSQVHAMYQAALALDGNCKDAKFGVAFTGLLMFLVDEDFNEVVEKYKHLYDTLTFNPLRPAGVAPMVDLGGHMFVDGIPLKAARFGDLVPSPVELDRAVVRLAAADPSISQIQARIEAALLPRIAQARAHLQDLTEDPNYTFVITPEMQGNDGASQIVLDRSDFQVFLAVAEAAEAGLRIFCARNLDLDSYTVDGIAEALRQESSFLSLRAGGVGTAHMTAAKARVLGCLNAVKQAVTYLKAEVGTSQPYDLIKVDAGDIDDLNEISDAADSILWYFGGSRPLDIIWTVDWECYWNGDWWECYPIKDTISATVDISKFFDAPINNYKDFLPHYSITIERLETVYEPYAALHFSRDRYWAAMDSIFDLTYPNDTPSFAYHLPDEDSPEFYRMLGEEWQTVFGWEDTYNDCYPYIWDIYCFQSDQMWAYRDYYELTNQVEFCYEWEAATFELWTFPNPTMNGLLPGMTSARLKEIWVDDLTADWFQSGCEIINIGVR